MSAVAASSADVAALEGAAQPVYTQLERDPQTKALIAAVRALKATTPEPPAATEAPGWAETAPTEHGREQSPSAINGTYHWRTTGAGARAAARVVGSSPLEEDVGILGKMALRDGKWLIGDGDDPEDTRARSRYRPPPRLRLGHHARQIHARRRRDTATHAGPAHECGRRGRLGRRALPPRRPPGERHPLSRRAERSVLARIED